MGWGFDYSIIKESKGPKQGDYRALGGKTRQENKTKEEEEDPNSWHGWTECLCFLGSSEEAFL